MKFSSVCNWLNSKYEYLLPKTTWEYTIKARDSVMSTLEETFNGAASSLEGIKHATVATYSLLFFGKESLCGTYNVALYLKDRFWDKHNEINEVNNHQANPYLSAAKEHFNQAGTKVNDAIDATAGCAKQVVTIGSHLVKTVCYAGEAALNSAAVLTIGTVEGTKLLVNGAVAAVQTSAPYITHAYNQTIQQADGACKLMNNIVNDTKCSARKEVVNIVNDAIRHLYTI